MAQIRFLSPEAPELAIPAVPAQFVDGVCDIDDSDPDRLERMRYLGEPFGVVEVGVRQHSSLALILDELDLAASDLIDDPASATSTTLGEHYEQLVPRAGAAAGEVPVLQADGTLAFGPGGGGGGAVASVNERTGAVVVTAADVGLDLVDNTSDSNKPVSVAVQAALDLKVNATDFAALLDAALAGTPIFYRYYDGFRYTGTGAMPRPATTRPVVWKVPAAFTLPSTGTTAGGTTAYVDGLDEVDTY